MVDNEKDKELQKLDSEIVNIENQLREAEKEYEDIVKNDGTSKIDFAKGEYDKVEEEYKEKSKKWSAAKDELAKLAELSHERKHNGVSYGTRLGQLYIHGSSVVVDRWALRNIVLEVYILLMSLDAPDVNKIKNWATTETSNNRLIALLTNTNNGPVYDQVDVDAGIINTSTGNAVAVGDIGKSGPTAPALDHYTTTLADGTHGYSAEGLLRQWLRFKYHMTKMVPVGKPGSIVENFNDNSPKLSPTKYTSFVFGMNPTGYLKNHANSQAHLVDVLTDKNSNNYAQDLIIVNWWFRPKKGVDWECKELYKVFDYPDFVNFFEFMFPNSTLSTNSLLQGGTNGLGPDSLLKDPEYKNFSIYPAYKGESSTTKYDKVTFKDGHITGTKDLDGSTINVRKSGATDYYYNECYAHKIHNVTAIGKGLYWVFYQYHNIFGNTANRNWFNETCSDVIGKGSTSKVVFSGKYGGATTYLRNGDEISLPSEPDHAEVTKKRIAYEKAQVEFGSSGDTSMISTKMKRINKYLSELKEKRRKLTGTTEQGLWNSVHSSVTLLAKDASKRPKKELTYYDDFEERIKLLSETLLERVAKHNNWKDDDKSKKDWKLWTAKSSEFPSDEKRFTTAVLAEIKKAYNAAFDSSGHATKARPLYGELNSLLFSKMPKDKNREQWLEGFIKDKDNSKKLERALEVFSELENHVALTIDDKELRDKLKSSEILIKSLAGMLEKILGKNYDRKILTRWEKTDYKQEPKFFELIVEPDDISRGAKDEFKTFLGKEDSKWASKYLADFLKEQEDVSFVVTTIMRFRIDKYLKMSSTDREEIKPEKVMKWFVTLKKHNGFAGDLSTNDGRSADEVEATLIKKLGRAVSEALGLDMKIETERNLVLEWNAFKDGNDFAKEIGQLKEDKEFLEKQGKDWKGFVKSGKPEDVIEKACLYKIEKTGVTIDNVSQIKKEDKEKMHGLEEAEKWLENLEKIGKATEEHKKLRAAIAAHKTKLEEQKAPDKVKETPKEKEDPKETPEKKTGGETDDEGQTIQAKDKKWYERAYYMAVWLPLLLIGAGVAVWYFGFRKPSPEEGEGSEGDQTPETSE